MDSLENINTVQDLLNAQETPSISKESQKILTEIYKLNPEHGLQIVIDVLESLKAFHSVVEEDMIEKKDAISASYWSMDKAKIEVVLSILNTIVI